MSDIKKPAPSFGSKAIGAYKRTDVMTADRETVLLMLYEGAIRFLNQAEEAGNANNLAERTRLIGRTIEILGELRASLNFQVSPEIAGHLEALYDFMSNRLLVASTSNEKGALKEVIELLGTLHTAWLEAIASLKKERSQSEK